MKKKEIGKGLTPQAPQVPFGGTCQPISRLKIRQTKLALQLLVLLILPCCGTYSQHVPSEGKPISPGEDAEQLSASLAKMDDQHAMVVWETMSWVTPDPRRVGGSGWDIEARLVDLESATPIGQPFRVNAMEDGNQRHPFALSHGEEGVYIFWDGGHESESGTTEESRGIWARVFNKAGEPVTDDILIPASKGYFGDVSPTDVRLNPSAARLDGGDIVVVWERAHGGHSHGGGIFALVLSDSLQQATEMRNNGDLQVNSGGGYTSYPKVISLASGGFAIVWLEELRFVDDRGGIYVQVFDPEGWFLADSVQVNFNDLTVQSFAKRPNGPAVIREGADGFVVFWEEVVYPEEGGLVRRLSGASFDNDGNRLEKTFIAPWEQYGIGPPFAAGKLADGRIIVAGGHGSIAAAMWSAEAVLVGSFKLASGDGYVSTTDPTLLPFGTSNVLLSWTRWDHSQEVHIARVEDFFGVE